MADTITDISLPTEETRGTYGVTIRTESGETKEGFIDPRVRMGTGEFPVYDSPGADRLADTPIGQVPSADFERAVAAENQTQQSRTAAAEPNAAQPDQPQPETQAAPQPKNEQARPAQPKPQATQQTSGEQDNQEPQPNQEEEREDRGFFGMIGDMFGAMGKFMMVLIGGFLGLFNQRESHGRDEREEMQKSSEPDAVAHRLGVGKARDKDGEITADDFIEQKANGEERIKTGKIQYFLGEDTPLDRDGDKKISSQEYTLAGKEMDKVLNDEKISDEIKDIARQFQGAMNDLAKHGTSAQDTQKQLEAAKENATGQSR